MGEQRDDRAPGLVSEKPGSRTLAPDHPAFPFIERRRKPRISTTPPEPAPPPKLDDYIPVVGQANIDELRFLAQRVSGKTVKMVNSTAVGGGVAEMLDRLVPLIEELGVPTKWEVITGGNDFFEVTKGFHNALHGGDYNLTPQAKEIFLMYTSRTGRAWTSRKTCSSSTTRSRPG